jgi:hypothetical protein
MFSENRRKTFKSFFTAPWVNNVRKITACKLLFGAAYRFLVTGYGYLTRLPSPCFFTRFSERASVYLPFKGAHPTGAYNAFVRCRGTFFMRFPDRRVWCAWFFSCSHALHK